MKDLEVRSTIHYCPTDHFSSLNLFKAPCTFI